MEFNPGALGPRSADEAERQGHSGLFGTQWACCCRGAYVTLATTTTQGMELATRRDNTLGYIFFISELAADADQRTRTSRPSSGHLEHAFPFPRIHQVSVSRLSNCKHQSWNVYLRTYAYVHWRCTRDCLPVIFTTLLSNEKTPFFVPTVLKLWDRICAAMCSTWTFAPHSVTRHRKR